MTRISDRLHGYKKVRIEYWPFNGQSIYVSHPIFPKIWNYAKQHHRWIIGIIFSILLVPFAIMLQFLTNPHYKTNQFYYLPSKQSSVDILVDVNCWPSLESQRSDSLRCSKEEEDMTSSRIDPCFILDSYKTVECPEDPFGGKAFYSLGKSTFDDTANTQKSLSSKVPWYIVLSNKNGCSYFTGGASAFIDGRVDYVCKDSKVWLSLPIETSKQEWSIRCINPIKNRVETCSISEAWF